MVKSAVDEADKIALEQAQAQQEGGAPPNTLNGGAATS